MLTQTEASFQLFGGKSAKEIQYHPQTAKRQRQIMCPACYRTDPGGGLVNNILLLNGPTLVLRGSPTPY